MLATGQDTQQLINSAQATARYNNQWSAEQAQKQMDFQAASNATAMKFSARQAQAQMDFQERMSNTAHQREVQDLIKAGLNPVLSAKYGGSSTPSGASASGVASGGSKGDTDQGMTSLFNGLLQAVIGQATALQTTAMNNQTSLQTNQMSNSVLELVARINAGATLGSASINAQSQQYMQKLQQAFEEEMKRKYPSTPVGAAASAWGNFISQFRPPSSAGYTADNYQKMQQVIDWFKGLIQRDKDLAKEKYQ